MKKAEETGEIVVRLNELAGAGAKAVTLAFAAPIVAARVVDGQERTIQADGFTLNGGRLNFDMVAYGARAFAVKLGSSKITLTPPSSTPLNLPFNLDVANPAISKAGGDFDDNGSAIPGGLLPDRLVSDGVLFKLAPGAEGKKNAVACRGQKIDLPPGKGRKAYLLAAASGGDVIANFGVYGHPVPLTIRRWDGFLGQWDTRVWGGKQPELTYNWSLPIVDLVPGYVDRDVVAWYADHKRTSDGDDLPYQFCYLFRYAIDLPDGARALTLPKDVRASR